MALSRPQTPFAHRRTVRLIVDNDMDIDELKIAKSLPNFATNIRGILPQFGGRCFDITLDSTDAAAQLAQSGFDYGDVRKPLKLLGARTIHVSIFLSGSTEDLSEVRGGRSHGSRLSEAAMLQLWGPGARGIGVRVGSPLWDLPPVGSPCLRVPISDL